jgi:hypothetical protein
VRSGHLEPLFVVMTELCPERSFVRACPCHGLSGLVLAMVLVKARKKDADARDKETGRDASRMFRDDPNPFQDR